MILFFIFKRRNFCLVYSQSFDQFDRAHKERFLLLSDDHPPKYLVIHKQLRAHLILQLQLDLCAVIGLYHFWILLDDCSIAGVVDEVYLGDAGWALVGCDVDHYLGSSQHWELEIKGQGLDYYFLSDWDGVLERGEHIAWFDCLEGCFID